MDLNPPERRGDVLTPHWENWPCKEARVLSNKFGNITFVFKAPDGSSFTPILNKAALDYGAHMVVDGIATKGKPEFELIIQGLSPGKHSLATYHNEVRVERPAPLRISVGDELKMLRLVPSVRTTNDYDAACAFFDLEAVSGKDVKLHFVAAEEPSFRSDKAPSLLINGFELDCVNPLKKAVKPSPPNDDEHVALESKLSWTSPAGAVAHKLYFGTDSNRLANAANTSAEFVARTGQPSAVWQGFNFANKSPSQDEYFWRVDEVDKAGVVTRGEVWRFRTRSLAFPTAEGYGRFARGGRGGRVIEVTNLQDYDPSKGEAVIPGSFRAGVEAEGPRTIIFRVSGLIRLKRPCAVTKPYCTIAGQTAPGEGVCLANFSSGAFGTHDVIIRFLRFRIGDFAKKAMDGAGLGSCDHCTMDHCSISWSSDEGTSSRNAKNITFQRNIVAEALHHSHHYRASDRSKYETHAFAGSISGGIGSFHHNLLAHCTDRNWSLAGGYNQSGMYTGVLDIRNNVVYNWTARTTDGGVARMNYVNNYYKPYPKNPFVKWLLKLDPIDPAHGTERYYMSGNILEGIDCDADNWKAFYNGPNVEKQVRSDQPLFEPYVQTQSARDAFTNVLADVGATFPKQDAIDCRLVEEVRTGTTHYSGTKGPTYGDRPGPNFAGIIDEPTDDKDALGSPDFPWPEYRTYNVPMDTDHDGIPDDWERKTGLDSNDPKDANKISGEDGYTNLEKYLAWLVGEYQLPNSTAAARKKTD